jgi:hypothetical protein
MTASVLAAPVSLFRGSTTVLPQEVLPLVTLLDRIERGTYRASVERLRTLASAGQIQQYRARKAQSLAMTPGCALSTRAKDVPWTEKLLSCTGLVHFDFDHLADPEALKTQLADSRHLAFAFVSPSGVGLKIGIAATGITGPASYKQAWETLARVIQHDLPEVHVNGDTHIKYLHALCYVSYDPALYRNDQALPFVIPPASPPPLRALWRTPVEEARVEAALFAIPNHDTDYDTWLTVGMALHSTGASWARDLWDQWSQQSAKFQAGKQERSWQSFRMDGKVQIGTVFYLAQRAGWSLPRSDRPPVPNMANPPPHLTAWLGPRDTWHGLPLAVERLTP